MRQEGNGAMFLKYLISNSTNEIVEVQHCQSTDYMLSDNSRFVGINKMMQSLLNVLEQV